MKACLRTLCVCVPLILGVGCSTRLEPVANGAPPVSTNAALFDPSASSTQFVPLPNILATAQAADPLATLSPNTPMNPLQALAYINWHEVGFPGHLGATNAVSGVNAPIYLRFEYPLDPATVTYPASAANIKVYMVHDDGTQTENNPLTFTDVSALFQPQYTPGSQDLLLFPSFPLAPATKYAYVVTTGVHDASTHAPVIPSVYFEYLKSTAAPSGAAAALLPIWGDYKVGPVTLLSGYKKVMDDLIADSTHSSITSRDQIALLGRFITTGAGFLATDGAGTSLAPVDMVLRGFAAGFPMGMSAGTTITDSTALQTYWATYTGAPAASMPASIGRVVLGDIVSATLGVDPVVVKANPLNPDLTGLQPTGFNPAGVLQPFRDEAGDFQAYYYVPGAVPYVYVAPPGSAPSGGWPTVIFQHGIGGNKEEALLVAAAFNSVGYAVLAIDLPCHGERAIPTELLQPGDDAATIHAKREGWVQAFMSIGAPLASRTNVQQAAFDLHRLELSATYGTALLAPGAPSGTGISYVGHSLGSIVGAYYLAGNTANLADPTTSMKGLLSVPGARLAYLLQASPEFGPTIDAGLAQIGISKTGAHPEVYHQFFLLTQTVSDTIDPATMTTPLWPNLTTSRLAGRILIQEAVGDTTIPNFATRYFGNALGGGGVTGSPLLSAIDPGFFQLGYGASDRIPAPFMLTLSGAAPVFKIESAALLPSAVAPVEGYFQFDQAGVDHSSLVELTNQPSNSYMQLQMLFFAGAETGTSIVVDPTAFAPPAGQPAPIPASFSGHPGAFHYTGAWHIPGLNH